MGSGQPGNCALPAIGFDTRFAELSLVEALLHEAKCIPTVLGIGRKRAGCGADCWSENDPDQQIGGVPVGQERGERRLVETRLDAQEVDDREFQFCSLA
jgi:hypothetical protein